MLEAMEKFSWMTGIPELEQIPQKPNVVRIKGVAGKVDVISRNNRHYVEEELIRSARTWIGKPVTINHADYTDPKNKMGEVVWMELDKDGLLEYAADVWKQPYVGLLKNKSADVKGVSVEAGYLHNLCPKCNQKFFDETSYRDHMKTDHYMTIDPKLEPHGMVGQALSLVLAPEEPGIPGTTVELMETVNGFTKLCETIIKEKEEKQTMNKIKNPGVAIQETDKSTSTAVSTAPIKVYYGESPDKLPEPTTTTTVAPTPKQEVKPITQPQIEKAKEEIHKEIMKPTATLEFKPLKTVEILKLAEPCSAKLKACVDDLIAQGHEESSAWAICKSKLGEIAGLQNFIMQGTVAELVNPIPEKINDLIIEQRKAFKRDQEITNKINESFQTTTENLGIITENMKVLHQFVKVFYDNLTEAIANIPKDDTTWKEQIASQPKDDITWKDKLVTIEKTGSDTLTKLTELEQRSHKEHEESQQKIKETTDKFETWRKDFEVKHLGTMQEVDQNYQSLKKKFEESEKENIDLKKKLEDKDQKQVKETQDITVRLDNQDDKIDKLKKWKGQTPGITETAKTEPITETPTHKVK